MTKILVIDDEAALRLLMADVLEEEGFEVIAAESGAASRDDALVAGIDLAITDLMMPDTDGLEVIANLKARKAAVKIIAVSGGGRTVTTDFLPMARELGADRILRKPFMPDDLLAEARGLLAETPA